MKLTIETFWQKVTPDATQPFGTRVLPEYERKSVTSYPNGGGWSDREAWASHIRRMKGFERFDGDAAIVSLGRGYGIHSYQRVTLA